ncbi:MAG: carbohydrate ABC transporter permease [Chloroflexota bacterium]|nr:carbohydrate ABC transporter permease [Chloroflexota bacterium]
MSKLLTQADAARPVGRPMTLLDANTQARIFRVLGRIYLYVSVVVIVGLVAFPLFWMIASSFKPRTELYAFPPTFFPTVFTLDNYVELLTKTSFLNYFKNSMIVAVGSTLLSMIVGSFGGYALSRFRYPGFRAFARLTLVAYMLPSIMLVIPLYVVIGELGLVDTLESLIITNTTFTLPFALWLLRSYFSTIPVELEEAAMIDGATRFGALVKVIVPLAIPGIVATSIFAFTNAWNEFLYALVFIHSDSLRTLPPGMGTFIKMDSIYQWGVLMAGSVLITVPVLIFYLIVQRNLVVGLTEGGVKA